MKQFPAYIMQLLPVPLAALAKLPIPEADLTSQTPDLPLAVLDSLSGAMRDAASSSSISADGKPEDASAAGMSRYPPPNIIPLQYDMYVHAHSTCCIERWLYIVAGCVYMHTVHVVLKDGYIYSSWVRVT